MTLEFETLSYEEIPEDRRPSLLQALVPVFGMVLFLIYGSVLLRFDPSTFSVSFDLSTLTFNLNLPSFDPDRAYLDPHIPLLWGVALTGLVGRYWIGISWEEMYEGIVDSLQMGMQAILILFIIYMLIATWTSAGTIPGLIYYGLELLSPTIFLPATALIATAAAFSIGSSWTTAATLGVAFMGVGTGLGIPAPMTAGAILTGAYTGDKITPLSDTTNLAAAVTNTDLMEHVRTMRVGTSLALAIAVLGYAYLGLQTSGNLPTGQINEIQTALTGTYAISPLVFLPLVVTFGLALVGVPALPTLATGVFAGAATSMFVQGLTTVQAWNIAQGGTEPETGVELVNSLLVADGLNGSAWTVSVVVIALTLGGLLERTGALATLAHHLKRIIHSAAGLTVATGASAFATNALVGQQYMSIVVPSMTFRGIYEDFDLESRNLSRAVESAGTTTSALIPWNAGGAFMTSVLGVSPIEYAPYYFLGFLSPLILVFMAVTGWQITYKGSESADAAAADATPSLDD